MESSISFPPTGHDCFHSYLIVFVPATACNDRDDMASTRKPSNGCSIVRASWKEDSSFAGWPLDTGGQKKILLIPKECYDAMPAGASAIVNRLNAIRRKESKRQPAQPEMLKKRKRGKRRGQKLDISKEIPIDSRLPRFNA